MVLHVRASHPEFSPYGRDGSIRCPVCGERFRSLRGLRNHLVDAVLSGGDPWHALALLVIVPRGKNRAASTMEARRRAVEVVSAAFQARARISTPISQRPSSARRSG